MLSILPNSLGKLCCIVTLQSIHGTVYIAECLVIQRVYYMLEFTMENLVFHAVQIVIVTNCSKPSQMQ